MSSNIDFIKPVLLKLRAADSVMLAAESLLHFDAAVEPPGAYASYPQRVLYETLRANREERLAEAIERYRNIQTKGA